jgi:hypothetical protein
MEQEDRQPNRLVDYRYIVYMEEGYEETGRQTYRQTYRQTEMNEPPDSSFNINDTTKKLIDNII